MADETEKVVFFPGATRLDIPPDRVLQGALDSNLREVVVIGVEQDGTFFLAHSNSEYKALWLAKIAERMLIDEELGQ